MAYLGLTLPIGIILMGLLPSPFGGMLMVPWVGYFLYVVYWKFYRLLCPACETQFFANTFDFGRCSDCGTRLYYVGELEVPRAER